MRPAALLPAFVASALLHLGLVCLAKPRPLPLFSPGLASSSPVYWVEALVEEPPPETGGPSPEEVPEEEELLPQGAALRQAAPPPRPYLRQKARSTSPETGGGSPGEEGASPGGEGASPGGEGASPGDEGTSPGDESTSPGDGGASPGNEGASPGGGGAAPVRYDDAALQRHLQAGAEGCYPVRARRFRFQGTARLAFCVDARGLALRARLAKSSGYESLDEAALECVLKRAQPLPPSSWGRCFEAPIRFGISP